MKGVCEPLYNEKLKWVAGVLWVPSLNEISLAEPTQDQWRVWPITSINTLSSTNGLAPPNLLVRVSGTMVEQQLGRSLVLAERDYRLRVDSALLEIVAGGSQVEAVGFLSWQDQAPVLLQAYYRALPGSFSNAVRNAELLTQVEQIRRLSLGEQELTYLSRIRGIVTASNEYVQDETAGIRVVKPEWLRAELRAGEFVELHGHAGSRLTWGSGTYTPVFQADGVKVLGKGRWPVPKHFSWDYLMTGQPDGQWIELRGVGRSAEENRLTLMVEGGQLEARIRGMDEKELTRWTDATLRLRGVYRTIFNKSAQFQGFTLDVPAIDCVQVEAIQPPDPFGIPAQEVASLLRYNPLDHLVHRVKVTGTVTHAQRNFFFMQDATGGLKVLSKEQPPPQPGDRVEVIGFPEAGGYSPVLSEASVRKVGRAALLKPIKVTIAEVSRGEHDALLVHLEAVVLGQKTSRSNLVLELQSERTTFQAILPKRDRLLSDLPAGSRVRLTGICRAEYSQIARTSQPARAFDFFLNAAEDVVVLSRPAWWTVKRTLWVLGGLVAVLLLSFAWAGSLRKQVGQRTRELYHEIDEHKHTEAKLEQKTNLLAGEVEQRKGHAGRTRRKADCPGERNRKSLTLEK